MKITRASMTYIEIPVEELLSWIGIAGRLVNVVPSIGVGIRALTVVIEEGAGAVGDERPPVA